MVVTHPKNDTPALLIEMFNTIPGELRSPAAEVTAESQDLKEADSTCFQAE